MNDLKQRLTEGIQQRQANQKITVELSVKPHKQVTNEELESELSKRLDKEIARREKAENVVITKIGDGVYDYNYINRRTVFTLLQKVRIKTRRDEGINIKRNGEINLSK